ncbi:hypothetical protein MCO_01940 [Bartonella sp. DB5-6]|uniref:hypothetical protein n=1 Tax=Bartonella sp. DB5-6 TaxID=1094755 RepID=UPI00026E89AC|nr:hypothetical protein [Bartonella sp. DB5-6]EJF74149.1 hypothetical protein MCO_01940 [Bartonella sp. DB5-6]
MFDIYDTIAMIVCLLSLLVIIVGLVLICIKKWRKNGLKTLGIGVLLFLGSAILGAFFFHKIEPDQVAHNNEIVSFPSTSSRDVGIQDKSVIQAPAEDTDKQSIHVQDKKSDKDDGLGFWGWFWLIFFAFIALSIFVHWQDKRKKRFKEKVSEQVLIPPPHIHPSSDLSVVNKMSPELEKKRLEKRVQTFLLCVLLSGGIVVIVTITPWLLVPILIVLIFFIIAYRKAKKEKSFEQEVALWQSDTPPSNFEEACEMFQELDASEYDYRLAQNEKLLGVQERVTFNIGEKNPVLGRLLVTNQAIVFESPEDNERTTWARIASVTITYQRCHISHRTGAPWNYRFSAIPNPRFTAVIRALGQPY